eukprot:1147309-Pelagomonas_calceolata.AAC.1
MCSAWSFAKEGGNEAEEEDAVGDLALEQEASRARLQEVEDQQQQRRNDLGGYILSLKLHPVAQGQSRALHHCRNTGVTGPGPAGDPPIRGMHACAPACCSHPSKIILQGELATDLLT